MPAWLVAALLVVGCQPASVVIPAIGPVAVVWVCPPVEPPAPNEEGQGG